MSRSYAGFWKGNNFLTLQGQTATLFAGLSGWFFVKKSKAGCLCWSLVLRSEVSLLRRAGFVWGQVW
jgi:hypothetical protein